MKKISNIPEEVNLEVEYWASRVARSYYAIKLAQDKLSTEENEFNKKLTAKYCMTEISSYREITTPFVNLRLLNEKDLKNIESKCREIIFGKNKCKVIPFKKPAS